MSDFQFSNSFEKLRSFWIQICKVFLSKPMFRGREFELKFGRYLHQNATQKIYKTIQERVRFGILKYEYTYINLDKQHLSRILIIHKTLRSFFSSSRHDIKKLNTYSESAINTTLNNSLKCVWNFFWDQQKCLLNRSEQIRFSIS